jgi:hypothetical protein
VLTLIPQLMTLTDSLSAPVVRPPVNDAIILKRLLDAGFYDFLIPFGESAREAQQAVAATHKAWCRRGSNWKTGGSGSNVHSVLAPGGVFYTSATRYEKRSESFLKTFEL